uniref:Uncharacterized protein n=1 Tax=Anguilla anguilla TaxID=7936 RepID=A0A0E9P9I5_ANGAN
MVSKCISLSLGCSARILFPSLAVYVRCSVFHILSFVLDVYKIFIMSSTTFEHLR